MHLKNKPPVLVPREYWSELEKLSKCALIDMVWSLAGQTDVESGDNAGEVIKRIRREWAVVADHRGDRRIEA